jgi:hypothetical protein
MTHKRREANTCFPCQRTNYRTKAPSLHSKRYHPFQHLDETPVGESWLNSTTPLEPVRKEGRDGEKRDLVKEIELEKWKKRERESETRWRRKRRTIDSRVEHWWNFSHSNEGISKKMRGASAPRISTFPLFVWLKMIYEKLYK